MSTTRWQPADMWTEVNRFHDEMNRLFGRWGEGPGRRFGTTFPAINMWENEDRLFVEAELPGFDLSDLQVAVDSGNQLTLKGERKLPELEQGAWHRHERGYGKFSRTISLPIDVDADAVAARFKNGVLTVELPKRQATQPRRIEVKAE